MKNVMPLKDRLVVGLSDLIDASAKKAGESLYSLQQAGQNVTETGKGILNKIPKVKVVIEK